LPPGRGPAGAEEEGLSLFLPAYNERENTAYMIGRAREVLERLGVPWEIILVDDGSTDGTPEAAAAVSGGDPRIRVVSHGRNRGFGSAVRTGILSSRLPWIFYTDCDGQFDLDELEILWGMRRGADVVSGYRRNRRDPGLRLLYSLGYNLLGWVLFMGGFKDVDCSFKLYRREIFERVKPRSTCGVIDLEILVLARGMGYRVLQAPVTHLPRRAGSVSFETFRRGVLAWVRVGALVEMVSQLLSFRLRTWRGELD